MTDQPSDHRAEAEKWLDIAAKALAQAKAELNDPEADMFAGALIGIGHALLAGPLVPRMPRMRLYDGLWETVPDPDIRCPERNSTGQCLHHQGHDGDHQWPVKPDGLRCQFVHPSDPFRQCRLLAAHDGDHQYLTDIPLSVSEG